MGNTPTRNYDYSRAGVAMLTLKANPQLFRRAAKLSTLPDGPPLWGFGNRVLSERIMKREGELLQKGAKGAKL